MMEEKKAFAVSFFIVFGLFFGIILLEFWLASFPPKGTYWGTILQIVSYLLCVLISVFAIRKAKPLTFTDFGLFQSNLKKQLLFGCLIGVILTIVAIPLRGIGWSNLPVEKIAADFFTFLFVAFGEELLFRGYLLTAAQKFLSKDAAILLASVLFGLAHLPADLFNSFKPLPIFVSMIFTILFSLILCALRSEFPKLFGVISLSVVHFIFDFAGVLL